MKSLAKGLCPATIVIVCTHATWANHYRAFAERSLDRYVHIPPSAHRCRINGLAPDRVIIHGIVPELLRNALKDRMQPVLHGGVYYEEAE